MGKRYCYRVGYCHAPYLLDSSLRTRYRAGIYGWNYDAFDIQDITITTGYRPIGGELPRELYADLNERAKDASAAEKAGLLVLIFGDFVKLLGGEMLHCFFAPCRCLLFLVTPC